jgi:hypothetical protein
VINALALIVLMLTLTASPLRMGAPARVANGHAEAPRASMFTTEIRPLLEQRCRPCHFSGGRMYTKLPFDRQETIFKLGTKLFTRIKDEPEREKIRRFLASGPKAAS